MNKNAVDLVIPMYNEEKQVEWSATTLHDFASTHLNEYEWRIIIADNASTDNTLELAKQLSKKYPRISYHHMTRKGRGHSLIEVWGGSNSEILVYMDTDLATDLKHLPVIIEKIDKEQYDLAVGSRNLPHSKVNRGLKRTIISKGYIALIKLFMGVSFSDAQCGFKAISQQAKKRLFPLLEPEKWDNGNVGSAWFFDTELLVIADKAGFKIYDEAVAWTDDPDSTVHIFKDALEDIRGLWRLHKTKPWRKLITQL